MHRSSCSTDHLSTRVIQYQGFDIGIFTPVRRSVAALSTGIIQLFIIAIMLLDGPLRYALCHIRPCPSGIHCGGDQVGNIQLAMVRICYFLGGWVETHLTLPPSLPRWRNSCEAFAQERQREDHPDNRQTARSRIGPERRNFGPHGSDSEPRGQTANSRCDKGRAKARGPVKNISKCHEGLGGNQHRTDGRAFQHFGITSSAEVIGCDIHTVLDLKATLADVGF